MNSDISSNLRLTTSGCKDIGIGKFKFVSKTHFLSILIYLYFDPWHLPPVVLWLCITIHLN